jgi:hypothetical protein
MLRLWQMWVSLGRSKGSLFVLNAHMGTKVCDLQVVKSKQQAKAAADSEKVAAQQSQFRSFFSISAPLATQRRNPSPSPDAPSTFPEEFSSSSSPLQPSPPITVSDSTDLPEALEPIDLTKSPAAGAVTAPIDADTDRDCFSEIDWTETTHNPVYSPEGFTPRDLEEVTPLLTPCTGMPLQWPIGSIFNTYPWALHAYGKVALGFYLFDVQCRGTEFWIRSDSCELEVCAPGACIACQAVACGPKLRQLQDHAENISKYTPHVYFNHEQLCDALKLSQQQFNNSKLKV